MSRKIERIIVHHSEGKKDTFRAIYRWQTTKDDPNTPQIEGKGWAHVAYHKVIERSGKIVDSYTESKRSGGTLHCSDNSLEVCLCGDFDDQTVTPEAMDSLKRVLVDWCIRYKISPSDKTIVGHKDVQAQKQGHPNRCPGKNLHDKLPELRTYVASEWAKSKVSAALRKLPR